MEKKTNIIQSGGFGPRTDGIVIPGTVISCPRYQETIEVEKVVKTGVEDTDFIIEKELKICTDVDRQDYIQSYADDVGLINIMKKVAKTGDVSLLNQRGEGAYIDTTKLPSDYLDAQAKIEAAYESFNKLPAEIRGNMTKADFVKAMSTGDAIIKKVNDYVASKTIKKETAEIKVEGEK